MVAKMSSKVPREQIDDKYSALARAKSLSTLVDWYAELSQTFDWLRDETADVCSRYPREEGCEMSIWFVSPPRRFEDDFRERFLGSVSPKTLDRTLLRPTPF